MGLESYLFSVKIHTPLPEERIIPVLSEAGMSYLTDTKIPAEVGEFHSYYFEIRSQNGLTEVYCVLTPKENCLDEFSVRFSILSPRNVIAQTFDFFERLNRITPITIYDTEIKNHFYRALRREGKLGQHFEGITEEDESRIETLCIIPLDPGIFIINELLITKRTKVLENETGEIIEGGAKTFEVMKRKGLLDRFIGWIRKEV